MVIKVVSQKDYNLYKPSKLSSMYFETEKVLEDQIIMSVDFSNDDKDFWGVNNAVNELLLKQ